MGQRQEEGEGDAAGGGGENNYDIIQVEEAEEPIEWRMPGVRTIMDIGDNSEEEDGEYMPPTQPAPPPSRVSTARKGSKGKKTSSKGGGAVSSSSSSSGAAAKFAKDYEDKIDAAEFSVLVQTEGGHMYRRRRENVGSVVFKFADSSSSSTMDFSCESNEMLKVFLSRASGASFITRMRFDKPATESYMRKNEPVDIASAGIEDVDESLVMALSAFDSEETRGANQASPARLVMTGADEDGGITVAVVVSERLFKDAAAADPSLIPNPKIGPRYLAMLDYFLGLPDMDHFGCLSPPEESRPDVDELYEVVKRHHSAEKQQRGDQEVPDPQHKGLLPRLRPYQKEAVRWMISREREERPLVTDDHTSSDKLHELWTEVESSADDGQKLYYNRLAGVFSENRPLASDKSLSGGILADEMGLGKTVEVLSLMLCNPRPDVPAPEPLEPILLEEKKKKKPRRRRRSPSPVEWSLKGNDDDDDVEDTDRNEEVGDLMQVDGGQDDSEDDSGDDEDYEPGGRASASKAKQSGSKAALISGVFGGKKTMNRKRAESDDDDSGDDGEYVPRPSTSRSGGSRKSRANPAGHISPPPPKKAKKSSTPKKGKKKPPKVKDTTKVAPGEEEFDHTVLLKSKVVTEKSTISDMVIDAIVKNRTRAQPAVIYSKIKRHLAEKFKKQNLPALKKAVAALEESGVILNTGSKSGCAGHYKLNIDHENFDTRGRYVDDKDPARKVIEEVITRHVYDGKAFVKPQKKKQQGPSLYEKVKTRYDMILSDMSEAKHARSSSKWVRGFFDTKVGQQDYFECVCGGYLPEDMDDKYRVQCASCQLWQHAECVKYDVSDPLRGEFHCPHCWTQREPVPSGATLIVSPSSISYQWIEEIQKHVRQKNVRMLFYEGTKQSGYIQPRKLAQYDIVITTYSVLQSETNYVDLPHSNSAEGRRFRNPKRFMAIAAPLPCVQWWRVCLDEAQMIENTMTKTAEMALRLSAVNRWCVTGTPIEKSLDDLFGLLLFLKCDPYSVRHWFRRCLYEPYLRGRKGPLERLLCRLMWRTAKKDVLRQIEIPAQSYTSHWLSFSPVEEHFYRTQHIECTRNAVAKLRNFPDGSARLSSMDRNALSALLNPLLRLRQSCCHPQAVRGQFVSLQKSTMTMEQLLEQMIKKVVTECEEGHRQYIASLNGLAGIHVIEEKWAEAAETYRDVLRTMEEYKGKIKTDTLQRLHTVSNLQELLSAGHELQPTLRDDNLPAEAEDLKSKYLSKYKTAVVAAQDAVHPVSGEVKRLKEDFLLETGAWYEHVVDSVSSDATAEDSLMKTVRDEMAAFFDVVNAKEFRHIEQKYPSARTVLGKLAEKVDQIDRTRDGVCKDLRRLENSPPEAFLNEAVACHLRKDRGPACKLCRVQGDMEAYEGLIFHFVKSEIKAMKGGGRLAITDKERSDLEQKGVFLMDDQRKGTWGDSEAERLMKALLKYARSNGTGSISRSFGEEDEVVSDGSTHLKMLEAMKKEFRLLRILWRQIFDHVAGVDELNMSVMRLRLRFEDEPITSQGALKRKKTEGPNLATREKDKVETIYILERHDLPNQKLKLVSDRTIAQSQFRKKFGQLQYLENLRKSDYSKKGGQNPELCPICRNALGSAWSVMQCGHCYCVECMGILLSDHRDPGAAAAAAASAISAPGRVRLYVRCPTCRCTTKHSEISYVDTTAGDDDRDEDAAAALEKIKGDLSTKMAAVVKTLVKIRADDPEAKTLVFSTWTDVLDILASALADNDIAFAALHAQRKFKRNLQKFKNRADVKVLLLPISSGANGLNLVEASHVILVEPILNPAQELQAIGRVHRIGQKRATVVHRFVIRSTIEERMHNILSTFHASETGQSSHSTEENLLTIRDLKRIFGDDQSCLDDDGGRNNDGDDGDDAEVSEAEGDELDGTVAGAAAS